MVDLDGCVSSEVYMGKAKYKKSGSQTFCHIMHIAICDPSNALAEIAHIYVLIFILFYRCAHNGQVRVIWNIECIEAPAIHLARAICSHQCVIEEQAHLQYVVNGGYELGSTIT